MTDGPPKTHIAADRLFTIALQRDALFCEGELEHLRHCRRCLDRLSPLVPQNMPVYQDQFIGKDLADEALKRLRDVMGLMSAGPA